MSVANLQAFRKVVNASEDLQGRIKARYAADDVAGVIALGKQHGFEFTEADLRAVFGQFLSNELSDTQLEAVVGGVTTSLYGFEQTIISTLSPNIRGECAYGLPSPKIGM